ncbi:MAG: thioredoxin domain-containing protein [Chloroflexi bacterium]|nr:thioredoxin domain-containing protein [Chloroflexota bacterium]
MEPELDSEYIAAGLVRFVYKHYIILGPESQWAAEASECAAEQDGFWFYKDKLFANLAGENRGSFTRPKLEALARESGLDVPAFKKCLDSGKYAAKVEADSQEARAAGYRGTPTLVIGDQVVQGLPSVTQLRQAIGAQLQKSGK